MYVPKNSGLKQLFITFLELEFVQAKFVREFFQAEVFEKRRLNIIFYCVQPVLANRRPATFSLRIRYSLCMLHLQHKQFHHLAFQEKIPRHSAERAFPYATDNFGYAPLVSQCFWCGYVWLFTMHAAG